ncbi:30S ribosomal protein S6 [candidate division WOR-3 bacterium]|nr:30S ribosomal protein S6 [candidate division WOR-3 bacterium]
MNTYECTFIVNPEKEEEIEEILGSVTNFIEKQKGTIGNLDKWGIKKLAYPIEGYENGYYAVANFKLEPKRVDSIRDFLKKNENIIRYLLVVKEGKNG